MTAKVFSATNIGFEGKLIEVECDTSNGLPTLQIVGLGNKAIEEAKERVRSAIKNSQLEFPLKRITVNLAPANLPKNGAHFDAPIAVALLVVSGQLDQTHVAKTLIAGELALDGSLRPINSAISYAETARDNNFESLIIPRQNAAQAALVQGVNIIPADSLKDIFNHFRSTRLPSFAAQITGGQQKLKPGVCIDDIKGQDQAKRALLIAAAGHHNILFSGPPGAGKTMLAKALVAILPSLSASEVVEVTKLHSLAGEVYGDVIIDRPFRTPHHSASHIALIGGGSSPRPGEISLAHRGVLFLDELPEYSRMSLEALRQPLEDRVVHIARASERVSYPADFMLVATRNPCPCGFAGDPDHACSCSANQIQLYQKKLSGPLLDRIDMTIEVSRVDPQELRTISQASQHQTSTMIAQVTQARDIQRQRFGTTGRTNAHISSKEVNSLANIAREAGVLLDQAAQTLHLSARSYFKIIKVARTIADLDQKPSIEAIHISEALQYRSRAFLS